MEHEPLLARDDRNAVSSGVLLAAQVSRGHDPAQQQLPFFRTLRLYRKAAAWSVFFSLGIIMTAFDPQLLGNLYAMPAFQRDFGFKYKGQYIISAPWQSALSMGSPIGQVVGALATAWPLERFGRKRTFAACVVGTTGCIFVQFFARSLPVLLVGELLGGLVLGCYAVIAPAYASEVCPTALRSTVTSHINLCFVIGQLLANCICAGTQKLASHWAYSAPFAIQWIWPIIILAGIPFAPESPWWLVRKGRPKEAEDVLSNLADITIDVKPALAEILDTDKLEKEAEVGTSYLDLFTGSNARRTEISVGVYTIQVLSGIYLIGYSALFFERAGMPTSQAFEMNIGFLAVGFVGTCLSWILLVHLGRRTIYTCGLAVLAILQLLIGILDCVPRYDNRASVMWAQSSLMLVWNFFYDLTVGPVCFVILCEVSATRTRAKTIAFATAVQATVGIAMTVAIPYLMNPDQANLRGEMGFFFGGLAFVSWCWACMRVPETMGRTYEELDVMFERGVQTRDFKYHKVL